MEKIRRHAANAIEIILSLLFIQGSIRILFAEPLVLKGPLSLLTGTPALILYCLVWFTLGTGLLAAKYFRHHKAHVSLLFAMFVTCLYVLILSVNLEGIHWGQSLTVVAILSSGVCWLARKMEYNYVSDKHELARILQDDDER